MPPPRIRSFGRRPAPPPLSEDARRFIDEGYAIVEDGRYKIRRIPISRPFLEQPLPPKYYEVESDPYEFNLLLCRHGSVDMFAAGPFRPGDYPDWMRYGPAIFEFMSESGEFGLSFYPHARASDWEARMRRLIIALNWLGAEEMAASTAEAIELFRAYPDVKEFDRPLPKALADRSQEIDDAFCAAWRQRFLEDRYRKALASEPQAALIDVSEDDAKDLRIRIWQSHPFIAGSKAWGLMQGFRRLHLMHDDRRLERGVAWLLLDMAATTDAFVRLRDGSTLLFDDPAKMAEPILSIEGEEGLYVARLSGGRIKLWDERCTPLLNLSVRRFVEQALETIRQPSRWRADLQPDARFLALFEAWTDLWFSDRPWPEACGAATDAFVEAVYAEEDVRRYRFLKKRHGRDRALRTLSTSTYEFEKAAWRRSGRW